MKIILFIAMHWSGNGKTVYNSYNNMYRNLFRSEVNIDQGIKEAVNSDQFLKPGRSLMLRGVQEMPADKDL